MKNCMHITNEYGELIKKAVYDGAFLEGITTAKRVDTVNTGFIGYGAAITGSSCYNLSLMEKEERETLLLHLYSKAGLHMNIARLTVGASDYSAEVYTYDDVENDITLEHFSIKRDEAYIIPMIKEILAVNPDLTLFASPWSPPGWMKTGGSIGGGYMRECYLDCYADYIVKFVQAYAAHGITIHAITPQNEAETTQGGRMPACVWHPDMEAKFISILRRKFDQNNIDTKIWCFDHNFKGAGRVDWCFAEYPTLLNDCAGAAFHYYDGSIEQTAFLKEKYPQLALHFTEGGPRLYDNYGTDWCKWALMIIKALSCGYSSFTGWNLMLDESGGPNVGPFFCGGLVTRNYASGELSFSGQYKAFRHFTSLTPASRIYPLSMENNNLNMASFDRKGRLFTVGCLAEHADGTTQLFLVNPKSEKEQVQYFHNGKCLYIEMLPNTVATVTLD